MSVAVPVIDYIDPVNRKIYLLAGVSTYHPVDDIYKEVRNLRRTDETLRSYPVFVSAGGNLPKNLAGTSRTPRFAIFNNTQVVLTGDTFVSGEQLFRNAAGDLVGSGKDCIDRVLSPADAYGDYAPPEAEVIIVSTGSGLSTEQDTMLQTINSLVAQVQALTTELHTRMDLNAAKPNTYAKDVSSITNDDFTLTKTDNGNDTVTVQRS